MNFFVNRYKEFLGRNFKDFEKYLSFKPKQTIRVNTLKIAEGELVSRLRKKGVVLKKIDWLKYGYEIHDTPFNLVSSAEYLQGYFFIQEAASQFPVQLLNPISGELVLDCCAAPGAKTTQLAQFMNDKWRIIALDLKKDRLFALRNNLERCCVRSAIVYHYDARKIEDLPLKFDKILLDAPCSGNFVQDKDWFKKRSLKDIVKNTDKQKSILKSALNCLKSKGILVYSTCSLEPEEDEQIVEWAKENFDVDVIDMRRFWPHLDKTQGFFVAKIRKP